MLHGMRDVLFCVIHGSDSHELLGGLYLDLFARAGKQGRCLLDGFQSRQVYGDD